MKQGWEIKKLGEVCTIERGGSPRPIQNYLTEADDGINWIKIGDATEGSKHITSTKEKIKPEGMKKSRFVHKGDFILSNSMSFGRPYILAVDGCIHDGWLVIHDNDNRFDKNYLYYYLGSPNIYTEFKRLAVGGVVNNLNSELVRNVKVCIPPLVEQEKIVAELDCLSGIIEKKKQQLKELDALAESIFYTMFGDPITNEKGWEVKRLGEVCKFSQGIQVDLPLQSTEKKTGWNKFLRIVDYTTNNSDIRYVNINNEKYYVKFDDVVVVRYGASAGVVGIKQEGILANNLFKLNHSKDKLNYIYLYCLLSTNYYKTFVKETAFGAAMPALNFNSFKIFNIIIPPLSLQQEFASKIEAIEKQKELIKESIKETETLFNARMQYYFG